MTTKLGKKLGKLRVERKLPPEEVGARLGVHGIMLKRWERAKEWPDDETLVKLAEIYEVPAEELLSIVELERAYDASRWGQFPFATIVFVVFMVFGYLTGYWHPGWVILLIVPFYRWAGEYFIRRRLNTDGERLSN